MLLQDEAAQELFVLHDAPGMFVLHDAESGSCCLFFMMLLCGQSTCRSEVRTGKCGYIVSSGCI